MKKQPLLDQISQNPPPLNPLDPPGSKLLLEGCCHRSGRSIWHLKLMPIWWCSAYNQIQRLSEKCLSIILKRCSTKNPQGVFPNLYLFVGNMSFSLQKMPQLTSKILYSGCTSQCLRLYVALQIFGGLSAFPEQGGKLSECWHDITERQVDLYNTYSIGRSSSSSSSSIIIFIIVTVILVIMITVVLIISVMSHES